MAENIRRRLHDDPDLQKMKILVQEKTGSKLANICNYQDPSTSPYCQRGDCFPCRTGERPTRGSCWSAGAVYSITCNRCNQRGRQAVYWGESGSSSYFRGKAHMDAFRRRQTDSILLKHQMDFHEGEVEMEEKDFTMKTVSNQTRPLLRQSQEGCLIENTVREIELGARKILMNGKSEFYQPGVVRQSYGPLIP